MAAFRATRPFVAHEGTYRNTKERGAGTNVSPFFFPAVVTTDCMPLGAHANGADTGGLEGGHAGEHEVPRGYHLHHRLAGVGRRCQGM